mmetsp:Transcript_40194/g.101194  ORF Transcript_40194/g.101194 Transcript_40194/m.101194 type:complete len:299 (+) Transcript_40194:2-898(+)
MIMQRSWVDGTTSASLLIYQDKLYSANVGDSETVLALYNADGTIPPPVEVQLMDSCGLHCPDDLDPSEPSPKLVTSRVALQHTTIPGLGHTLLTRKHRAGDTREAARISRAGGTVLFGRVMGSLALSRALGDADFKMPNNNQKRHYVLPDPFLCSVRVSPPSAWTAQQDSSAVSEENDGPLAPLNDAGHEETNRAADDSTCNGDNCSATQKPPAGSCGLCDDTEEEGQCGRCSGGFVVCACDGLWDVFSYTSCVEFVHRQRLAGAGTRDAAVALTREALRRGSTDNVTVVVIYLDWQQ